MTNEMTLPCPYDICDGSGMVEQTEDDTNATYKTKCPCTKDVDYD